MFNMAVTLLSVLLCCCMTGIALAQKGCRNPEGQRGRCVEINNCPPLYALLNSRPLSSQTIDFLRRSQCGFNGRTPLVCCVQSVTQTPGPIVPIDPQRPPQPPQPQRPPPQRPPQPPPTNGEFNVESHPNARLLPRDTCGLDFGDRIWGGDVTGLDEHPWLALLQYRTRSGLVKFLCGGVLISKRYILTAAHCVHQRELGTYSLTMVRLGEFDLDSDPDCEEDALSGRKQCSPPPQDFGVEEAIPHPGYNPQSNNKHDDIALVRLDRDAKVDTDYVKPICLPPAGTVEIGRSVIAAGWGYTEKGTSSPLKLKVEVPVVSSEECGKVYAQRSRDIGEGQICAGGITGKDSCRGDSGGPLMDWADSRDGFRRYNVAGIVSYGPSPCGRTGWPGVYTKVFQYIPWILDNIKP